MNIITPYHKGPFAASWLASTTSKYYDADIDVVDICNKLLVNFNSKVKRSFEDKGRFQCLAKNTDILPPFRMFSRLFYGTLKIYQKQVDNLLSERLIINSQDKRKKIDDFSFIESTEDLLKKSDIYGTKIIKNLKRKSTNKLHGVNNKRQRFLTKSQISKATIITTNYNYLFDDQGNTTKQTIKQNDSITELSTYLESSEFSGVREVTQLQIHEYTVHEVNTETFYEIPQLYDDFGFGEVINEGFDQTNQFYSIQDSDTEPFIVSQTIFNALASPQRSNEIELLQNYNDENERLQDSYISTISHSENWNGNVLNGNNKSKKKFQPIENKITNANKKRRLSKLIIDEHTKIDAEVMRKQIENFDMRKTDYLRALYRQKLCKNKKRLNAEALLTRFNKRSFNTILNLKQKICLESDRVRDHYISLIRSILKTESPEDFAAEIYPKWQTNKKSTPKRKYQNNNENSHLLSPEINHFKIEPSSELLADVNINDNNNVSNDSNVNGEDWRVYGVMMQLLDIWHYSTMNKINAIEFCTKPKSRIHKATAFSSLLVLVAKEFIEITKCLNSIEMNEIKLGKASEKLIYGENYIN
uniref:Rad21/Rec8-like protein N-terminal domain-containing protein n=1 Tax=Glossina brevipalpis TaxID=37001 RepID=A0A1A9WM27_9MUSC